MFARTRTPPSQYAGHRVLFHAVRTAQLVSSLVVGSIMSFFIWHLTHDHWHTPWTFIVVRSLALLFFFPLLSAFSPTRLRSHRKPALTPQITAHSSIAPNRSHPPAHHHPPLLHGPELAPEPRSQHPPLRPLGHGLRHAIVVNVGHPDPLLRYAELERQHGDHGVQDLQGAIHLFSTGAVSFLFLFRFPPSSPPPISTYISTSTSTSISTPFLLVLNPPQPLHPHRPKPRPLHPPPNQPPRRPPPPRRPRPQAQTRHPRSLHRHGPPRFRRLGQRRGRRRKRRSRQAERRV